MNRKVLVIDDSALARRRTRSILEPDHFDIIEAADGASGLQNFVDANPDLVVLDLTMAGMNGLEVLRHIKLLNPLARVIVVSADVQPSSERLCLEQGADGFLAKPVVSDALLELVRSVVA